MNATLKNVLAVVLGLVVGSAVNMGLVLLGGAIVPPPKGVDVTQMASIKKHIHLFQPQHFLFPFLAHALGTLAGAAMAAWMAASKKQRFAMGIGIFFLVGGIANAMMLPAPTWFLGLDLVVAYLPMGWLAWKMVGAAPNEASA